MKHLTNREEEIMELFWQKGALYVKEVIDEMPEKISQIRQGHGASHTDLRTGAIVQPILLLQW